MFKVGDKVRVVRKVASFADGWQNSWVDVHMDDYVNDGHVYTIKRIYYETGVVFEENERYGWPPTALELVEDEDLEQRIAQHQARSLMHRVVALARKQPQWTVDSVIGFAIEMERVEPAIGPAPTK